MASELVTLATYRFPAKAEAAQWALRQEGIESFVMDANIVAADWFLGNAIGYVKLQVRTADAEAAAAILQATPRLLDQKRPAGSEVDESGCLRCGAPMEDDDQACDICGWTYGEEGNEDEDEGEG